MANYNAIHSVGNSLRLFLQNRYPASLKAEHDVTFELLSSAQLGAETEPVDVLGLYLYRVTVNEHLRNTPRPNDPSDARPPLSLDLHYLVSAWVGDAMGEHRIIAWAMQQLYQNPVLDVATLSPEAGWDPGDVVQVIPAELSTEDLMRVWDALDPSYRLSVSYIARMVRIGIEQPAAGRPAVAVRHRYGALEQVR
jgi:hypothetical protein